MKKQRQTLIFNHQEKLKLQLRTFPQRYKLYYLAQKNIFYTYDLTFKYTTKTSSTDPISFFQPLFDSLEKFCCILKNEVSKKDDVLRILLPNVPQPVFSLY